MLKPPDIKVYEALANLEHNGNFKVIMDWLNASLQETTSSLAVAVDVPLYRAQGAFGVLDALHNHTSKARDIHTQLSNRSK